ncbi:DnaJ-domain-containing protein [Rostrohypoxylon terebratum]|nr:DnaJ-domain-containing protein [Rostrohypoxylon terebratum]
MLHTTNRKRKDRFDFYQQFHTDQNISTEPPKMVPPKFPNHDLYNVLGVSSDASLDEIKKAYRELCKKVHPDKAEGGNNTENNERFQRVQEAWEILRDEVLRNEYDQYRASGARDSDRNNSNGRRHRERKERKERNGRSGKHHSRSAKPKAGRTHSYQDDTYEPKPNRSRKPYYEDWSESDDRDGSKSYGSGPEPGSWHYGTPPPYYESAGPSPPPPPPPPPRHDSYGPGYRPQSASGPRPVSLEDRIIVMRIRVDLNQVAHDLDNLQAEFAGLKDGFMSRFNPPDSEKARWKERFDDVMESITWQDNMYDFIHYRLERIESGYGSPTTDLPELLGILQAHVTRMKYSLMAAIIILGQINEYMPYEAQQQLLKMLQSKLNAMQYCTDPAWASRREPSPFI